MGRIYSNMVHRKNQRKFSIFQGGDTLLIYDKIKAICEEKSLSIRQVEVAAGLKNGAISKWNDSSPTIKSLKAVADVLKVKVDKLIS